MLWDCKSAATSPPAATAFLSPDSNIFGRSTTTGPDRRFRRQPEGLEVTVGNIPARFDREVMFDHRSEFLAPHVAPLKGIIANQ